MHSTSSCWQFAQGRPLETTLQRTLRAWHAVQAAGALRFLETPVPAELNDDMSNIAILDRQEKKGRLNLWKIHEFTLVPVQGVRKPGGGNAGELREVAGDGAGNVSVGQAT